MQQDNDPKNTSKSATEWLKKKKMLRCCTGPGKVQTSTRLKFCGGTLRELCINKCPQTYQKRITLSYCC